MRQFNLARIFSNYLFIFFISTLFSILTLLFERSIGIGWDYHPDAVTYMNKYGAQVAATIERPWTVFNNLQYIVVWLFQIIGIELVFLNIAIFSVTNVLISKIHFSYIGSVKPHVFALMLLLINPYRLHLSTTILKDTAIILIVVLLVERRSVWYLYIVGLMYRIASIVYIPLFFPASKFIYVLFGSALISCFFFDDIYALVIAQNAAIMQFRDFDRVPNFASLGLFGIFLRCVTWPLLVISGSFFVIAPSLQYCIVAMGSIGILCYIFICVDVSKVYGKIIVALILCSLFALATTGFNSFLRYVYPILVVLPLVLIKEQSREFSTAV